MLWVSADDPGSSPRMRGAPMYELFFIVPVRIIPADAGSTVEPAARGKQPGDHPRGCGEHSRRIFKAFEQMGSSPRMRGAQTRGKEE